MAIYFCNLDSSFTTSNRVARWITLILLLSIGLVACSDSKPGKKIRNPNFEIDPVLEKINLELALLDLTTRMHGETSCIVAKKFAEIQDKDQFTQQLITKTATECELARYYVATTRPSVEAIRQRGRVIEPLFEFSVIDLGESPVERSIGPFMDIKTCNETEALAHSKGEATQRCERWEPVMSSQSPAR